MERLIYLDHNSTAPYSPSVKKYLQQGILEDWYNPSSVYSKAQILNQRIRNCREFIAGCLNCSSKYLFFTSSGTESINTVLFSETLKLNQLSTIITSHLEHHATLKKIDYLSHHDRNHPELKQKIRSFKIKNNGQGEIDFDELEELCSKYPQSLISLLSANNETGVITDIQKVSHTAKKYNCLVHVDATQSLGKTPFDLEQWDVDFASFSGHKIGAMKGIGLLYARKPFAPLMYGGKQEKGLRPGTHNYPAIQSLKLAVQDIDLNKQKDVKKLRDYLENHLLDSSYYKEKHYNLDASQNGECEKKPMLPSTPFKINCRKANRLPNTSNIYCGGVSSQAVLLNLNQKGVCVSAGSACHSGSPEPSHVMTSLNIFEEGVSPKDYAKSCIRISLSSSNTKKEIDFLIQSLREIISVAPDVNTVSPV